jgi:CDP-glucose 4,6-dehydratase
MNGIDPDFWRGRRVLVTGHSGFKGSWLTLWLVELGARVTGLSLPPRTKPNLFDLAAKGRAADIFGDVEHSDTVLRAIAETDPEIVLHMGARALLRPSYVDPVGYFRTNVLGTANVLQAVRAGPSVKAVVVVTSDKVYENPGVGRAFAEDDRLGGHDPYSASKSCSELVTAAFRRSFLEKGPRIATARAGNVIGGGDWSPYRIVVDLVAAYETKQPVELRYPQAVRPWQHVLEPLAGYLMLAQALAQDPTTAPESVNFGPDPESFRTVSNIVEAMSKRWGGQPGWIESVQKHPFEDPVLTLAANRARTSLGWRPLLGFDDAVAWTADWYSNYWKGGDIGQFTRRQIADYTSLLLASRNAPPKPVAC